MKKDVFQQEVRKHLLTIPLAERRLWRGSDLMVWWQGIHQKQLHLIPEKTLGDVWQVVHACCLDLIGPHAL